MVEPAVESSVRAIEVTFRARAEVAAGPRCPKCGTATETADSACRACGLLRARFDGYRADDAGEDQGELDARWRAVAADWSNPAAHDRYLRAMGEQNALPLAARHYRAVLASRPGDPVAVSQLERVRRMLLAVASVTTDRPRDDAPTQGYRALLAMFLVLLLAGAGGLMWAHSRLARAAIAKPPPRVLVRPPSNRVHTVQSKEGR